MTKKCKCGCGWEVFYADEMKKERDAQKKRQDRQRRAYTKSFKQKQKFGAASEVRVIYPEKKDD